MKRNLLQKILTLLAKLYLWRYRPEIIAVTGNVGKTSAKEAIAAVLSSQYRVRSSGGNLNNDIGVPLAILGDWTEKYYTEGPSLGFWFEVILGALIFLIIPHEYPEILVLEYGADRPGDIGRLARTYRPHIGVVTAVGETPVHVEFFASPQELAGEKAKLVKNLQPEDYAILNFDDLTVLEMRDKTRARVLTFGRGEGATIRVSNIDFNLDDSGRPEGISFKVHRDGGFVPFKMLGALGYTQALSAATAIAVGTIYEMNMVDISEALANRVPPPGRMRILPGIRNSVIIDDSYNAAPASMDAALETLRDIPASPRVPSIIKRKIAVLGDMLELGALSVPAHQKIGNLAGRVADILVCVGEKAKLIADAASDQMPQEHIFT
ncbi:MAG: UDP-N-acetylmuramoyl-tripeptide--D-alanyl-D-alanine ligase, partial [Candidatus Yanofskybacteria bacterium]|nr:UDP-N-acetylmuramoyl-tripeptide--D-alanyl-D-alanine ligase [Candidatus Yanofskybacteria bacterium]